MEVGVYNISISQELACPCKFMPWLEFLWRVKEDDIPSMPYLSAVIK
jgi:hypothetical protein